MKNILIATGNPGKRNEILSALLPIDGYGFVSLDEIGIDLDVAETGTSYEENAMIKAQAYFEHAKMPVIAEDSGIEVFALQDELGIHTNRWGAGEKASDEEWLDFFMNRMKHEKDRAARFISHVIYMDDEGHQTFEGECLGEITHDIEGPFKAGIQLSAVFKPLGEDLVYSAMDEERKNSLSHRGKGVRQLRAWLMKDR